jgi:hypothetical protein
VRTRLVVAALTACVPLFLPACGGGSGGGGSPGPTNTLFTSLTPVEPDAGTWRTWLLANGSAIRPAAPATSFSAETAAELAALNARAAARTPAITDNVDAWNLGTCKKWNEFQRGLIVARSTNPPKAARGFGLVATAMYDSMVAVYDAKYHWLRARPNALPGGPLIYGPQEDSPSHPSTRAALSAAANVVLKHLFPLDAAAIDQMLVDAQNADLDSGTQFQSDVDAGVAIGNAVAALAIAHAAADHGDDAQPTYTINPVPGHWSPGPGEPATGPLLPGWGAVTTWVLSNGSAIRPPGPPAYGSTEWNFFRDDVLNVQLTLTPERQAIATFWADGPGTVTPPGHWTQIAVDECASRGLTDVRTARVLALLGVAQHDAFVACWECKYAYDCIRPVMDIRATVPGQSAFLPFITPTPHFPSYPSGHSTTSGAASQVLGALFPDSAIDFALMGDEAKDSRLYGGIHYRFDNDVGANMGRIIGGFVVDLAGSDGSD